MIRVLVVDDHRMIRHLLRNIIESHADLEFVGEAADGVEAVQQARALQPHVILMDVNMPGMNGLEATRAICSEHKQVAVIGLSIHDDPQLTVSMRQCGAVGYVIKGATAEEIYEAIRSAVGRRGS